MAGDVIAIERGQYTGNFNAYKDVTLEHPASTSPAQPRAPRGRARHPPGFRASL